MKLKSLRIMLAAAGALGVVGLTLPAHADSDDWHGDHHHHQNAYNNNHYDHHDWDRRYAAPPVVVERSQYGYYSAPPVFIAPPSIGVYIQ